MRTVNIHDAKTHLSRLIAQAVAGQPFIIAKAGRPLVKVVACAAPAEPTRVGFLSVPAAAATAADDADGDDAGFAAVLDD